MKNYSLENPFAENDLPSPVKDQEQAVPSRYQEMVDRGRELLELPKKGGGESRVQVPGILNIKGRDVALYGHDFTVRAGSMDATNGAKLARQILMAGDHGIPLIGMNDSAGAFVPAGVGGLDGYSEAFQAMRKISGVVPSIMLMFGYNAGGGAYLPRQGSFLIQPNETFFGLTGPDVVREALGEDITPDELGGPKVHSQSGVVDLSAEDELGALRTALRLLSYLPDNNRELAPFAETSLELEGYVEEEAILLRKTFADSPSGFNTPLAFGRMGGSVVGFLANNSAFNSGNIDVDASRKGKKFMRFCNLFNTPVIFLEDVSGYAPGSEQEQAGIVQAGRELLDSIIDLRVPRLTLIVRNAFGGAYCAWNSYHIGADFVFALPSSRIAVMGPAGRQYVYKDEYRNIMKVYHDSIGSGKNQAEATAQRDRDLEKLTQRYERELLNPEEALKLGSVSSLVMPGYSRQILGSSLQYLLRHYQPEPLSGPQRE